MDFSPLNRLPEETFHEIFTHLHLRDIYICRCVCKAFNASLSSQAFLQLIAAHQPPLSLLFLRRCHGGGSSFHVFDTSLNHWFRFPDSFIPFRCHRPITSSHGLLYLWAKVPSPNNHTKSTRLVVCSPVTGDSKVLPPLGSAWRRHGSVAVGSPNQVLVLTGFSAAICSSSESAPNNWEKFSFSLPSNPRGLVLISDTILALCDVEYDCELFMITIKDLRMSQNWNLLERPGISGIFKQHPCLLAGEKNTMLMIGRSKISCSRSTILILRLNLERFELEEAGRMPAEMFEYFQDSKKMSVFGGGRRVCVSGKNTEGRLALWEEDEKGEQHWRWVTGAPPNNGEGLYRGFMFQAPLPALPYQNTLKFI